MAAMSLNEGNVVPTLVGARVENAAKGSGMSGGKRAASQSPTKPGISANLNGRQRGPDHSVQNGPGVVAAATRVLGKPHAIEKKTQSGGNAANEASGAMSLKSPVGRLVTVRTNTPVRARNASDESLDDVSSKGKEAGGAQENFIREDDEDEDNEDDADEDDDEEDVELTLLRQNGRVGSAHVLRGNRGISVCCTYGYPCQAGGKPLWGGGHCCHGVHF